MATEARSVMRITTELRHCVLRTWRVQDKAALLQHAYNRKVWGQGIATAAARAMAALALSGDDFVRLEAKVFAWNPGSMRVLEKAGFVREGVLRCSVFKDGQIIDSVLYARVRDDA
jgi:ribosomal-protein-alanine N-acetyltransferase